MKRWHVMALAACVVIGVGIWATTSLSLRTLASRSVNVRGSAVEFQITERDGLLYVSARERRAWSNGWQTIRLIGSVDDVGTEGAAIATEADGERVRLQVGNKATIEFDSRTRSFLVP